VIRNVSLKECEIRLRDIDGLEPQAVPIEFLEQALILSDSFMELQQPGVQLELVSKKCRCSELISALHQLKPPVFPLSAKYLIDQCGLEPGSQLGAELKRLRLVWKDNGFTGDCEEILELGREVHIQ
jgi:hypothetical protein